MNEYNINQYGVSGYENVSEYGPTYNSQMHEHNIAADSDYQRQFQIWGPFVGGLTGLFGPTPFGPPGPPPGRPPFGPPPGPPPGRPPFGPPGPPQHAGPPTSPPPAFTPSTPGDIGLFAVDPGAIRGCLYRYTYVWLTNRQQFWFYPVFVGRTSVAGYRWTGFNWVYFGIDLRRISSFQCF